MKEHRAISVLICARHLRVYFAFGISLIYEIFIAQYNKQILNLYKIKLPF